MEKVVVVHHSEIVLKGRKRSWFEQKLADNIHYVLGKEVHVRSDENRLVLYWDSDKLEEAVEKVSKVFGVSHAAIAFRCNPTIEEISELALQTLKDKGLNMVAIDVKRSYKKHGFTSQDVRHFLGRLIAERLGIHVDRAAENFLYVEITRDNAYVYLNKVRGFGGLPVGTSGKVLSLLSGGIDSAVASVLMMRRGCRVDFLHFHSYRTSEEALEAKMKDLVMKLAEYGLKTRLYMASFTPFYKRVFSSSSRYELLLFRKYMLEVAGKIAEDEGYRALVLGDSLGQVASQTLENIAAVKPSSEVGIFRPLIGMGKDEIIELADRFSLTSIVQRKYKDCCSIVAVRPTTHANAEEVEGEWRRLDLHEAVDETLQGLEKYLCTLKAGLMKADVVGKESVKPLK